MDSNQPKLNTSDEIDLLDLFAKVILAIKSNFVTILVSFFVGCLLGLAYYQVAPNVYESRMLISSDILTESYSKSIIDNLLKLIEERNTNSLSKKLGLPVEQANKVVAIKIKSALERPTEAQEANRIYLNIEAKTVDNSIWPQLQNGIMAYLQNNEFVKIRVEQKKRFNIQMIEKINLELIDLEKLKTNIAAGSLSQSDKGNLVLFDPTNVNSKILELNKDKINLQNSLETINSVQLVEGFTIFEKPAGPKLSLSLIAGSSVGLIFACLFIAFQAIRAMLKFSEQKLGKS